MQLGAKLRCGANRGHPSRRLAIALVNLVITVFGTSVAAALRIDLGENGRPMGHPELTAIARGAGRVRPNQFVGIALYGSSTTVPSLSGFRSVIGVAE
jgi:hypothetical protein